MEEHQVIIVGAGPAGTACAKALKEEEIDALIIEKEQLPRYKTCSGVLFGQTQVLVEKYFGQLPPKSVYCKPEIIRADDIKEWSRERGFSKYVWELPKGDQHFPTDYLNIWRNKFDYWLLEQSGAEYIENCSLRGFSARGDKINVEVTQKVKSPKRSKGMGKTSKELICSYLIGADGGNSKLRKLFDPSWGKENLEAAVFQAYYRFSDRGSLTEGKWHVFFEPKISDILCCVHQKDDLLVLCVGGFKERNLKDNMEDFKRFLSQNFKVVLRKEERVEGCAFRQGPPNLGGDRIILTGEAAGFIYLNGEGISAAIDSGYRAGKAVLKAIKEGANAIEIYREQTVDLLNHIDLCREKMHFLAT